MVINILRNWTRRAKTCFWTEWKRSTGKIASSTMGTGPERTRWTVVIRLWEWVWRNCCKRSLTWRWWKTWRLQKLVTSALAKWVDTWRETDGGRIPGSAVGTVQDVIKQIQAVRRQRPERDSEHIAERDMQRKTIGVCKVPQEKGKWRGVHLPQEDQTICRCWENIEWSCPVDV